MPAKGHRKCISCERFFDFESFGFYAQLGDDEGKPLCDICYSDDHEVGTIFYSSDPDYREEFNLGSYVLHGDDESMFPDVWEYARSVHWKSHNAWRGYFEAHAPEGWVQVEDTWFCGFDGHNVEGDLEKFHEKWSEKGENPNFPLLVAFLRTSNVFATGIEIYVPEENKDDFINWINQ